MKFRRRSKKVKVSPLIVTIALFEVRSLTPHFIFSATTTMRIAWWGRKRERATLSLLLREGTTRTHANLFSRAHVQTILWISFCSTVICASPSSAAVVSSSGSSASPVQVFLQTQNQLVFVTESFSGPNFQEPDSVKENALANSKGVNAGAALVREYLRQALLKERGENCALDNRVQTLKRSNLLHGSGRSSRDDRYVTDYSDGSEGNNKDGKKANRRV